MPKQEDESIDRLFRPLTDLQSEPGAALWGKIEMSLANRKSKRRVIAFWCMGGVTVCSLLYVLSGKVEMKKSALSAGASHQFLPKDAGSEKNRVGNHLAENESALPPQISGSTGYLRLNKPIDPVANNRVFNRSGRKKTGLSNSDQADSRSGQYESIAGGTATSGLKQFPDILPQVVHLFHPVSVKGFTALSDKSGITLPGRSPDPKRATVWSVTPYFSQELAGYSLADHDSPRTNGHETEQRERNVFSASAGIYINYQLRAHWIIQSGINYAWSRSIISPRLSFAEKNDAGNVQYKVNTTSGYGYFPHSGATSIAVGDSAMTGKVYSKLAYVSLPLTLNHAFYFGRVSVIAGGGASLNILTSSTIETRISEPAGKLTSTETMHGLKKTNYGLIVKAEIHYALNRRCDVAIFPAFKSVLSPINLQTPQSVSPYNFGLGFGMTFRL